MISELGRMINDFFLNILKVILFMVGSLIFLVAFFMLVFYIASVFYKPEITTVDLRPDIQTLCRENDAMVLSCPDFVRKGDVYFLEKKDGKWGMKQTFSITPYLKGWAPPHLNYGFGRENDCHKHNFAYNDKYLCIMIERKSKVIDVFDLGVDEKSAVLIFDKKDSKWVFRTRFKPKVALCHAYLELIDDLLIVSNYTKVKGNRIGCVYSFNLAKKKPKLVQAIYSPKPNYIKGVSDRGFFADSLDSLKFRGEGDTLIINWLYFKPNSKESAYLDPAVYKLKDGKWTYQESLLERFEPFEPHLKGAIVKRDILDIVFDPDYYIFIGLPSMVYISRDPNKDSKVVRYATAEYYDEETGDLKLCGIKPRGLTVRWRGKNEKFVVVNNLSDKSLETGEEAWIVNDCDRQTYQQMCDYYKSSKSYHDISESALERNGCKNYYEFTSYIPRVDCNSSGTNIITSYLFDECYIDGSPLQEAKVWGGVNIYEVDPEEGPKKIYALITNRLSSKLTEVSLDVEETPEDEEVRNSSN